MKTSEIIRGIFAVHFTHVTYLPNKARDIYLSGAASAFELIRAKWVGAIIFRNKETHVFGIKSSCGYCFENSKPPTGTGRCEKCVLVDVFHKGCKTLEPNLPIDVLKAIVEAEKRKSIA